MKVDGFVALQGRRRQLLVQTLLHFKVKLHSYILAPLAPCYFRQVFSSNILYICVGRDIDNEYGPSERDKIGYRDSHEKGFGIRNIVN